MSNKRPFVNENLASNLASSPAFSPPETPGSMGAYSPRLPNPHLGLPPARKKSKTSSTKRRKSSQNKLRDERENSLGSAYYNQSGSGSGLVVGGGISGSGENSNQNSSNVRMNEDEDQTDQPRVENEHEVEEEENLKELDDDDYTVRKRDDLANKDKLRVLLEHFDSQQRDRYTEYRNSGLAKANVRKLANIVLQQSVSDRVTIVTRGLAKVFVGHMVEKALEVQRRRGGSGPLTVYDLKEAYRAHLAERDRGGSDRRKMFCK